jgi:hypothetical protein
MGFEMSLSYETAMYRYASVSALHMSKRITYNFYLALTEEQGTKIQQNKVPSKTFNLIRVDKLEKVNNCIILIYQESFMAE